MLSQFQSTRPRGARQLGRAETVRIFRFNPRAHAGRDHRQPLRYQCQQFQSTRPRGARPVMPSCDGRTKVSIHAPTRGATIDAQSLLRIARFNPRAHAGRDNRGCNSHNHPAVSIHAPTRGATGQLLNLQRVMLFQSTRPRGARHSPKICAVWNGRFNPRAHAGRDNTGVSFY